MRNSFLFTSESVSEGHPDKVADQIQRFDRRPVPVEGSRSARRLRNADHDPARRAGGRDSRQGRSWTKTAIGRPAYAEEVEAAVRETVREIGYEQDGFPLADLPLRKQSARPVGAYRAGRRCRRKQGRGRGRPGHHVRLCIGRNARSDARDARLQPQDPRAHGRRPQGRHRTVPRARCEEPGHAALRQRTSGRGDRDRRVDPACARLFLPQWRRRRGEI